MLLLCVTTQQTVFVADEKGIVQRRVLTIGHTDNKIAEVLSGLRRRI